MDHNKINILNKSQGGRASTASHTSSGKALKRPSVASVASTRSKLTINRKSNAPNPHTPGRSHPVEEKPLFAETLNFNQESLLTESTQQSITEWVQGTFDDIKMQSFDSFYDGEIEL